MKNLNDKLAVKFSEILNGAEIYVIMMSVIYSLLLLIFSSSFENPLMLFTYNVGIAGVIMAVAFLDYYLGDNRKMHIARIVFIAPIIYICYLNTQFYVRAINPVLYDQVLIDWDNWLFGGDVSRFFDAIRTPFLTEFLQICYVLFFFLPVFHGIELFFRDKKPELNFLSNQIVFGFLLSYMLYLAMPAIGPRFTIFDIHALNTEIPGLFLTDGLREFVNSGGGFPAGCTTPELSVNRDCMPSGHTWLTIMNIVLAFRFRSKLRYVFLVIGGGLIIATLYMRYHYGVDVLAGIIFAVISIYLEPVVRQKLKDLGFKKI